MLFLSAGVSEFKARRVWLAVMLGLLVLAQASIFSIIGRSGGRVTIMVNWIPLVFYGIGLTWILRSAADYFGIDAFNKWWLEKKPSKVLDQKDPGWITRMHLLVSVGLLLIGTVYPLSKEWMPERYSQNSLEQKIKEHPGFLPGDQDWKLFTLIHQNLEILHGKIIYPQYFRSGERMLDDRKGRIPEFSYERVEFFLIGTKNIWVTLPGDQGKEYFPHGGEIIVIGTREPERIDLDGNRISMEYIKSEKTILLDPFKKNDPEIFYCSDQVCLLY
jgi:hypothetical protein